jgi:hypothetical protein
MMAYTYPDPKIAQFWYPDNEARDKAVNKGLMAIMKEEKLSLRKLCAKIQHENQAIIDESRRYGFIRPAHERLFNMSGGYAVVKGFVCTVDRNNIVVERLYPLREFWYRVYTQTENLYHTWNFWMNAITQAEKGK